MNFDLDKSTIFMVAAGSHAYGFSTDKSDHDYRGIAIPPLRTYIGLTDKFDHAVGKDIYKHYPPGYFADDPRVEGADPDKFPDLQIYEIRKFMGLAIQNNPSIIEILFTDESDWLFHHKVITPFIENRDKLLTKQVKSRFCGYAFQQLKRIKRHKKWLDNPPQKPPERSEFGLPEKVLIKPDQLGAAESLIQKEIDGFMIHTDELPEHIKIDLRLGLSKMMRSVWAAFGSGTPYPTDDDGSYQSTEEALKMGVMKQLGFKDNFIELITKEKSYRNAMDEWNSFQRWKKERNPQRAELEKKMGYDGKHACHLVRLIRMAREILEQGKVFVKRPDAEELFSIRNGAWPYEKVVEFADSEDLALQEVAKNSKLPSKPAVKFFDGLVFNAIQEFAER